MALGFWRSRKYEYFLTSTDNTQVLIRKAHMSFQLRWAKNKKL
jgi:hypothetical protein